MKVTIDQKNKKVTIECDLDERSSKSGKNTLIASSGGNKVTETEYKGHPVVVGLNVYINKEKTKKEK